MFSTSLPVVVVTRVTRWSELRGFVLRTVSVDSSKCRCRRSGQTAHHHTCPTMTSRCRVRRSDYCALLAAALSRAAVSHVWPRRARLHCCAVIAGAARCQSLVCTGTRPPASRAAAEELLLAQCQQQQQNGWSDNRGDVRILECWVRVRPRILI